MLQLHIPDMSCGHCQQAVKKAVATVDPEATIAFDMDQRRASLTTTAQATDIMSALETAGYPATSTTAE